MKMLIVAHEQNFTGGANRSLLGNILKLRDTYKVEIMVLVPSASGEFNKKLTDEGIKWINAKYFGVISALRHDNKDWLRRLKVKFGYLIESVAAKKVLKKVKEFNPDIIYTNTRLPIVGALLAKKLSIPHVVHVREFGGEEPLWGKWGYEKMYELSSKIILISYALKEKFEEYVPSDKLVVSHNGIAYKNYIHKYKKLENEVHMILTGRLVPDKGHADAINALSYIYNNKLTDKNIVLHIVGSSPKRMHIQWYEEQIKKLAVEKGVQENVVFEGEIRDMFEFRKGMDIELVCSIRETFGRVTVEAMRSDLFVIGSNSGGTPELISNLKTGLLYEYGNYEELAQKILLVVNDNQLYNAVRKQAFDEACNKYTVEKNCAEIYEILKSCI